MFHRSGLQQACQSHPSAGNCLRPAKVFFTGHISIGRAVPWEGKGVSQEKHEESRMLIHYFPAGPCSLMVDSEVRLPNYLLLHLMQLLLHLHLQNYLMADSQDAEDHQEQPAPPPQQRFPLPSYSSDSAQTSYVYKYHDMLISMGLQGDQDPHLELCRLGPFDSPGDR